MQIIFCIVSFFVYLKKSIEIIPREFKHIKKLKNIVNVLKRFTCPYPLGDIYLAMYNSKMKLIPLFNIEKNEKIIPFLNVFLLFKKFSSFMLSMNLGNLIIVSYF